MENFISNYFAPGLYVLAISFGIMSFVKFRENFSKHKNAEIELTLFVVTLVILVMDWIGFNRGFHANTNQVLLVFWLLINVGCFIVLFHSSFTYEVFNWIVCVSIFNLNNVFWHLNYAKTSVLCSVLDPNASVDFASVYVFLIMGLIGVLCMFTYCIVFNWVLIKGFFSKLGFTSPFDFARLICILALASSVLLYLIFSAFYPLLFAENIPTSHTKMTNHVYIVVIFGSIAVLGIIITAFLFFAQRSGKDQSDKAQTKKNFLSIFVIIILGVAITKAVFDLIPCLMLQPSQVKEESTPRVPAP
jgi:ammonia channel protein AmtB